MYKVAFGEEVKDIYIPRFRAETEHVISIIPGDVFGVFTHYHQELNSFYCFKGECCEYLGFPFLRYVLPIVEYATFDKSSYKYAPPLELKYLSLGKDSYKSLITKVKLRNVAPDTLDFLVICHDSKFQKIEFDIIGPAYWRTDSALTNLVLEEFVKRYHSTIKQSVARTVSKEVFHRVVVENQLPDASPEVIPPKSSYSDLKPINEKPRSPFVNVSQMKPDGNITRPQISEPKAPTIVGPKTRVIERSVPSVQEVNIPEEDLNDLFDV